MSKTGDFLCTKAVRAPFRCILAAGSASADPSGATRPAFWFIVGGTDTRLYLETRMIHQKLIDTLSSQFSQLLSHRPDGLPGQQELQSQIRTLLQSSFARLDLVTRDEFDAQQAVLLRTRERLEQLEARLAALESAAPAAAEDAAQPEG